MEGGGRKVMKTHPGLEPGAPRTLTLGPADASHRVGITVILCLYEGSYCDLSLSCPLVQAVPIKC